MYFLLQQLDSIHVTILHKEEGAGLGFSLAGGADLENKVITVSGPAGVAHRGQQQWPWEGSKECMIPGPLGRRLGQDLGVHFKNIVTAIYVSFLLSTLVMIFFFFFFLSFFRAALVVCGGSQARGPISCSCQHTPQP